MTEQINVGLIGMGRMGRALALLAPDRGFRVVAELGHADVVTRETLRGAAVAIEFTTPQAALTNVRGCIAAGCAVVVGTTGWYDALPGLADEVRQAGGAMLAAPNFSVGVAVFDRIIAEAARLFDAVPGFDAHLIETHHAAKRDAPSGTAASLVRTAQTHTRRPIPITSVRTGSVPGTHEVVFDAPFEQVRLVHEARDRRVFAEGALTAARWLVGRRGVYSMQDVLGTPTGAAPSSRST